MGINHLSLIAIYHIAKFSCAIKCQHTNNKKTHLYCIKQQCFGWAMSLLKDARKEGTVKYERHKPEQTLLYQIIEKYYPQFLNHMGQQDKCLPKYVRSEFEEYLKCGRLEYGFLRVRCEDCHHEHLVAFSWPLLRIHALAAFVHPALHHAEDFVPAVVRGEWQKAPPCWLMMCCLMSPLGNGY